MTGYYEPTEIVDPDELRRLEDLAGQFKFLDIIRSKMPEPGWPQAGSSLAGDDRWADPYHVTHSVVLSLGVALDQLKALDNLVIKAESVHPYATFSLIRPAIENAASALWLLTPGSRKERVTRRLRMQDRDFYARDKLHKAMPNFPDDSSLKDRLSKTRVVADKHSIGKLAKVQMTEIVHDVGNIRNYSIEGAWQITSGVIHGQMGSVLTLLKKEVEDSSQPVANVRLSASLVPVVWGVECARLTIQEAHRLLIERGTSHIG